MQVRAFSFFAICGTVVFSFYYVYLLSEQIDQQRLFNMESAPATKPEEIHLCPDSTPTLCTFRFCNTSGHEQILHTLYGENCNYHNRTMRVLNVNIAAEKMGSAITMFPESNFIESHSCKDWFFSIPQQHSGGRINFVRGYIAQKVSTTGISSSVIYKSAPRNPRYLVIYAASTKDEYQSKVTNFTLSRLRESLRAFIIAVEMSSKSNSIDADVVLFADSVSPETFYDSVGMQEGMLEAYRLFGTALSGFYGLVILNDSIIGPITDGFANVLPAFPESQPVVVTMAVWSKVLISGAGILVNRAAFTSSAFINFWLYVRFPCGKWGSMMLWEGSMRLSLVADTGSLCMTFTNDISAINAPPSTWGRLPFYKHKNSPDREAVLQYIDTPFKYSAAVPLSPCDV